MKTKIKRHSRSVLAVVLTLCMLVSCMTVGIIATDAAKTADERVGANADVEALGDGDTTYYLHIGAGSAFRTTSGNAFTYDSTNSYYYCDYAITANTEYVFVINTTSGTLGDGNKSSSTQTVTTLASSWNATGASFDYNSYGSNNYDGYDAFKFKCRSDITIRFTFTSTFADGVTYRLSSGGGGGESGGGDEPSDLTTASKGAAPVRVLVGTDIMFYICSHNGTNIDLCNSTPSAPPSNASSKDDTTANTTFYSTTNIKSGDSYVQVTKTSLSSYNRITNNLSGNWNGQNNQSTNISNATGGELFWDKGDNGKTNATSCTTTIAPASVIQGGTITFSTTCEKTKMSHGDQDLYYQYYIDNETTPIAVASEKDSIAASGTTAQDFVLSSSATSALSVGSHTLRTVATDGGVYYISDTDTFTVTAAETKHAVTISANPAAGGTVSPSTGTEVGESTSTEITATPSAGYEFSSWTFGSGITYSSTANPTTITTKSSGDYTVQANFTAKPTHTITVTTNNPAYGTASASVASAYQGQEVTLTATVNSGVFKKWTVTSGTMSTVNDKTDNPLTFTMGDEDLTITANFDEYTAASPFYYNSYGSDGQPAATHYGARMTEAKISGETFSYYHVQGRDENDQLFTVSYGSPKYNSWDCFFDIEDSWQGVPQAQFYATDGKNLGAWADMTWKEDKNSKKKYGIAIPDGASSVKFKHGSYETSTLSLTSGNNGWYTNGSMDSLTGYDSGYNPVPVNFYENFNGTNKYTNAFSTKGFYNHGANRGEYHNYTKPKDLGSTKGDYYIVVLYKNKTYTINGETKKITNNPEIIWMPTLPTAGEDTTETVDIYAKNGTLRDSTFNRFTNLADTDFDTTYFEYTESLDSGVYTYTSIADYNDAHSKKITYDNAVSGYNSDYAIMKNVPIGAKIKIKTTLSGDSTKAGSFNNTAFKDTHYLKAYSFNGMTYEVHTANNTGVYEEVWTVRDVNTKSVSGSTVTNLTKDGKTIEVTPIYYMQDNTNCKTFYIDGYDGTVQNAWGNMLCVYPYYEGMNNKDNAFGGYPGQPMLFWGGKYQMEIPLTVDGTASGASVKGLTLHNSYWDLLHRSLDIRCNARNHAQTYDYDDFYKLYKEKNPDTIIFDFKYRTTKDNFGDRYNYTDYTTHDTTASATTYSGNEYNGVELVTDYFGRQVDAFGTLIADNKKSDYDSTHSQDKELLFVSTGFKDTYVGEYATLWAVYAPQSEIPDVEEGDTKDTAGKFIGYISSSMLYLNNWDRRLQYTGGDSTEPGRMSWTEFEKTYKWLEKYYKGVPALISYEKEIWNDSKDKAYRSDGKWYYSNKGDQIEANIIIQYNADIATSAGIVASKDKALSDTTKWTTDAFSNIAGVGGQNNIGLTTGCAAYFTNTSPNLLGKVNSGTQFADSTKSFTFRADAGGSYMFVNWVRLSNGKYYEISEKELAESVMSSNDTYIARFVKSASGSLKISHVIEQNGTYKGTGTPTVTVTVSNGSGTQVFNDSSSDGAPIDISSYVQTKYSAYTVNISLSTTPDEDCALNDISTTAALKYHPGNISNNATTVQQFTIDDIIKDNVTTLRYVSHLTKTEFTYNYEITYTYYSRFWGEQSYTQTGECENGDFTGSKTGAKLTTDFIIGKTPYEKSFRQQINWNYTTTAVPAASGTGNVGASAMENNVATDQGSNTYKMTAHVYASKTVNDKVTAEFVLPYNYKSKSEGYTVQDTDVYTAVDGEKSGTSYLYNTGNESVTLTTSAYKLFTYDDIIHSGSDNELASSLPLMEAPEYLWMDENSTNKVQYHTKPGESKRYYTGNSFTVNGITYYLREKPDKSAAGTNEVIITDEMGVSDAYTVNFTKRKNETQYGGQGNETTYHFAVSSGTPGTSDFKVYFFAYAMDNNEEPELDQGKYVFNGQYIVFSETDEKDGIIENTGVKKYFTRWDIFNTKGNLVASCFNRRFNFSGYDNYVVRPVYESDEPNHYASSTETGLIPTISYLDDSRNQWNKGDIGNYADTGLTDALYAGDKIFTDFAITYRYNGLNINTVPNRTTDPTNGADIKIGMVIEKLDALDTAGGKYVTDVSYYANKYKTDTDYTALVDVLPSGTGLSTAVRQQGGASSANHACYNSKIGANDGTAGYTAFNTPAPGATQGQTSVLDNFNRLQWFYTFNNSTKATSEADTVLGTIQNCAFRAIPYMIVTDSTGTTHTYITDSPAYFTFYDTATRAHN